MSGCAINRRVSQDKKKPLYSTANPPGAIFTAGRMGSGLMAFVGDGVLAIPCVGLVSDSAHAVARIDAIDTRPCCLIARCTAAAATTALRLHAPPWPDPPLVCADKALSCAAQD